MQTQLPKSEPPTDLWVEKRPVLARLYLDDGTIVPVTLFLAPAAPTHPGSQTVTDLYDEPDALLRCRTTDGEFAVVGKEAICAIAVSPDRHDEIGFRRPISASVTLAGGHGFRGELLIGGPAGRRVSDLLNEPDPWLCARHGETRLWLRKSRVVTVHPDD